VGAGSLGMYYGQRNGTENSMAANPSHGPSNVVQPAAMGGTPPPAPQARHGVQYDTPVAAADPAASLESLITGQGSGVNMTTARNVIIVPQDRHRALIIPVSVDRTQVIY